MTADAKVGAWMPLLIDRYLGDTSLLTTEQHGAYMLLLMAMWKAGGVLPDNDAKLASAAKLTPGRWRGMRETLRPFFRSNGKGGLLQKRLMIELQRAEQRADAGQKGAKKRWRNDSEVDGESHGELGSERAGETVANAVAKPMAESCSPPKPIPTEKEEPDGSPSSVGAGALASEACKAMRAAGLPTANPSSPELLTMLEQGMTVPELVAASVKAINGHATNPFQYALTVARSERQRAATRPPLAAVAQRDQFMADILAGAPVEESGNEPDARARG